NPIDSTTNHDFLLKVALAYIGDLPDFHWPSFTLTGKYAEASPIFHVSPGDAPFLMYNSDDDPLIAARQMLLMDEALRKSGITSEKYTTKGQGHAPIPNMELVNNFFQKH